MKFRLASPSVWLLILGCATPNRPCSTGGQPPREPSPTLFEGTKRCYQVPGPTGKYVNDGKYFEWFPNEKLAIQGEYEKGKKTGRWIEYDENGNKISDEYFKDGKQIQRP